MESQKSVKKEHDNQLSKKINENKMALEACKTANDKECESTKKAHIAQIKSLHKQLKSKNQAISKLKKDLDSYKTTKKSVSIQANVEHSSPSSTVEKNLLTKDDIEIGLQDMIEKVSEVLAYDSERFCFIKSTENDPP